MELVAEDDLHLGCETWPVRESSQSVMGFTVPGCRFSSSEKIASCEGKNKTENKEKERKNGESI
jgi:hypothetical protein